MTLKAATFGEKGGNREGRREKKKEASEDSPEGEDCEGAVGLVGAAVGKGRPPKVVPQQLREWCRWQHIGIGLYGSAATRKKQQNVRQFTTKAGRETY